MKTCNSGLVLSKLSFRFILLLMLAILLSNNLFSQVDNRQYVVKTGDFAPDFEMKLPDGNTVHLSDLKGKVVMLQFTASWCGVCRQEMPHIESDIWKKHKADSAFALFGVDRDEPADKIISFVKQTGVSYPIGLDPKGAIFAKYAESGAGITRNVIIDKTGRIVMLTRLYDEKEFAEMTTLIDKLLSKN